MPLTEIYLSRFIVLNLFSRSEQFVELTSHQTQRRLFCDNCNTLPILLSWIVRPIYFYLVILNSQILLNALTLVLNSLSPFYVCCGYDLPLDRSVVNLSIYLKYYNVACIYFSFRWGPLCIT